MATFPGTSGNDTLIGTADADDLSGLGGLDVLKGLGGMDLLDGGSDNDILKGGAGDDTLLGDDGDDRLIGGLGFDTLDGGDGSDVYQIQRKDAGFPDAINDSGASGTDTLDASAVTVVSLSSTFNESNGIEVITGSNELQTVLRAAKLFGVVQPVVWDFSEILLTEISAIVGTEAADTISGSGGEDLIKGLAGADVLDGGGGNDTLRGGRGDDTLSGGVGDDVLKGGNGEETLDGGAGDDKLLGEGGDDILNYDITVDDVVSGGTGTDTLNVDGDEIVLDLTGLSGAVLQDIEIIDLGADGANTLVLDTAALRAISEETDTLQVLGGIDNSVITSGGTWAPSESVVVGEITFDVYTSGSLSLLVESGINVDGIVLPTAVIETSQLNGENGVKVYGEGFSSRTGTSVAGLGDVNGDGFDDFIVGATSMSAGPYFSGAAYVVFGSASGLPPNLYLENLDGQDGFQISGAATEDYLGYSVSGAGDVNGDGYADILVGAHGADPGGPLSGAAYVLFGKASASTSTFELSSLDGTNGFRIPGAAEYDKLGLAVASAGDINGDGLDDIIVGAFSSGPNGKYSGGAYVVFGSTSPFESDITVTDLDGTNGFAIAGESSYDYAGISVSSAGDVNGDGFSDLLIGAHGVSPAESGAVYVVFGTSSAFAPVLELNTLNGNNGFRILGAESYSRTGRSADSAGDFNGDGYSDLIIGAPASDVSGSLSGSAYLVYGKASGFGPHVALAELSDSDGFQIRSAAAEDYAGFRVAGGGDINGDGFDDVIVGAFRADPNGDYSGSAYIVFGGEAQVASGVDLSTIDGTNGFRIDGENEYDRLGVSVSSAGDVNGDGLADVIVGATYADLFLGAAYIIFGADFSQNIYFQGHAAADSVVGSAADDILMGGAGADTLDGAAGDDYLNGGSGGDEISGGDGTDTLAGGNGNDLLSGGSGVDRLVGGDGSDRVDGGRESDVLIGGRGHDVFEFADAPGSTNVDVIMDFKGAGSSAIDIIQLKGAVFTGAGSPGELAFEAFESGAGLVAAATAAGRIIYNTTSGILYYDADGAGGAAAVRFAVIASGVDGIAAEDFVVI